MNKKVIVIFSTTVIFSFFAFNSFSNQETYNTVEKCTSLLPNGYSFSMNIEAEISTVNGRPSMSGELHLSDGSEIRKPELNAKVEPFKQCVLRLLK